MQEWARKEVERAFGVLKSKWTTISQPCIAKNKEKIDDKHSICISLKQWKTKHAY